MKKFIESLVQSNLYMQIGFCAFYRFLNILSHAKVIFFLILVVLVSQGTCIPLQEYFLFVLKAGLLWIIGSLAKPSLLYPACHTFLAPLGLWFFCSLIFLLYSLSSCFFLGIFLALLMIVSSFFLMNGESRICFKKNLFCAVFYAGLFFWREWISMSILFLFFSLLACFFYALLPLASLFFVGYLLVFTQLIIVKSLCTNNDCYYHQGS